MCYVEICVIKGLHSIPSCSNFQSLRKCTISRKFYLLSLLGLRRESVASQISHLLWTAIDGGGVQT